MAGLFLTFTAVSASASAEKLNPLAFERAVPPVWTSLLSTVMTMFSFSLLTSMEPILVPTSGIYKEGGTLGFPPLG